MSKFYCPNCQTVVKVIFENKKLVCGICLKQKGLLKDKPAQLPKINNCQTRISEFIK